jgi:predicted acyl esterase
MDFIVKISEQFAQSPDQRAGGLQPAYAIVTKGWLRASHRERDAGRSTEFSPHYTHARAEPLTPGRVYEVEIPLQPIAYRFRQGNRIRVEVANGDSPVTDALFFHIYRPDKMGADTVHHDADHPSRLILPVMRDN